MEELLLSNLVVEEVENIRNRELRESLSEVKRHLNQVQKVSSSKLQYDESGDYLFMQTMSDNFDVLQNIQEFSSTPHINISPEKNKAGLMPEGTQVVIEIAYRL